jgi:Bacterial capsule synthesis protein PGA_cap
MTRRWLAFVVALSLCSVLATIGDASTRRDQTRPVSHRAHYTAIFTGDFLATPATWTTAHAYAGGNGYDYRPMLARLRPLATSADVAICHLETPLTGPGVGISDYPNYAVPHQLAGAIRWAGYDGCSTASNHSLDRGAAGIRTTLDRLDLVGLKHAGTARSAAERRHTTRYWVNGAALAHLSFTWSFNGHTPAHDWEANRIDAGTILRDARRARRRGADLVVLSLHWGNEHQHAVTHEQAVLARLLLRTPAIDLIVGHHAHVVQPIGRVGGRIVAYGLGNSLSGMTAALFSPAVQDGMALVVGFQEGPHRWHVDRVRFAPTWVTPGRWIVRLVAPALERGGLASWEVAELRRSWTRTVHTVAGARIGVWPFRQDRLPHR